MDIKALTFDEQASLIEELANWLLPTCFAAGMQEADARAVANFALQQLVENWDKLKVPNGIPSLRKWLELTATREYFRLINKEKRNYTISLNAPLKGDLTSQEAVHLEDLLADTRLDEMEGATAETVDKVSKVLGKMPARCQVKMRLHSMRCENTCLVLWTRYSQEDSTVPIHQLAFQFGLPQGTMYDRICECRRRFKTLWEGEDDEL